MCAGNSPKSHSVSGLTSNGGRPGGDPAGSAPEKNATRLPRASIGALLLLFALATPAAGQVAAGGVMRFSTDEVAFMGGFGGVAADVWLRPSCASRPSASRSASERAPPSAAQPSSRTSIRPSAPACASAAGSAYSPRWTRPGRSRCRAAASSSAGEDLHDAREAPVAPRHPRRHQPARKARPDPPHPPRHRAALRRLDRPGRHPHADLRGRDDRLPENAAPGRSSSASSGNTGPGPPSAAKKNAGSGS